MRWTQSNSGISSIRVSRRGVAAIWALVVLAVLMIVIELLAVHTANGIRRADHHHHQIQALWLARSGVELAAARLLANPADYNGETLEVIPRSQVHIEVHKTSDTPDIFRITCEASAPPHPQLGRSFLTQDPGRALITGKCADAGSILMQQFRGLTARAPYFANGSARDLSELVDFFDRRFKIGFTEQEKQDLVNFLSVL